MQKTETDPLVNRSFRGYRILRRIASGGMGAVYLVVQESLGRKLAAKVLYKELNRDPTNIERLHREALATAKLDHPHIVAVHDVFQDQGRHFLIMEYVQGRSLLSIIKRQRRLDLAQAIRLLLQTAAALDTAHKEGLIHRDIKPGNILIDANGNAKVADFGIVKISSDDAQLTQTGFIVGTPHYISPEQAMEGKTDPRSDIYSLGATFYEVLTGRRPFHGRSATETIRKHLEEPLIPPSSIDPKIPEWLSQVISKMMSKRPEHRYPSCSHLIAEIRKFLRASHSKARIPVAMPRPQQTSPPRPTPREGDRLDKMIYDILDGKGEDVLMDRLIDEEIGHHKEEESAWPRPAENVRSEQRTGRIDPSSGPSFEKRRQEEPAGSNGGEPWEEADPEVAAREQEEPDAPTTESVAPVPVNPVPTADPATYRTPATAGLAVFLIVVLLALASLVLWEDIFQWGISLFGG